MVIFFLCSEVLWLVKACWETDLPGDGEGDADDVKLVEDTSLDDEDDGMLIMCSERDI